MICQNTVRKSYLLSAIVSDTTAQAASVSDTTDNIFPHRVLAMFKTA